MLKVLKTTERFPNRLLGLLPALPLLIRLPRALGSVLPSCDPSTQHRIWHAALLSTCVSQRKSPIVLQYCIVAAVMAVHNWGPRNCR